MKHIIIGTAGHVDHGKSAIIKALTGIETDRLKEEKLRGISIDLGFAPLELSPDFGADIVDVPGHERFLKNMLAGTGAIDLVMLVIAADEGIMPQTREHLAMLQLYGIQHGVVVLNKIDKVDEEWLELIQEEIETLLTDTFLAGAFICQVSARTGVGLPALREKLLAVASKVTPRDSEAPFRMWIDRVFTIKGYGMVVTGSVLSGTVEVGDSLLLYPASQVVRIRGLECQGHKVDKILAGQRAAINIVGIDKQEIKRGMCLSAEKQGQISNIWDMAVQAYQPIKSGTRVRLHIGTGEFLGRVYLFKDHNSQYMRLILEDNLAASGGDLGIIRLYSPQYLLGGIVLIAPSKDKRILGENRIKLGQALVQQDIDNIVYQILVDSSSAMSEDEIMGRVGYKNQREVKECLGSLLIEKKIIMLDHFYIVAEELGRVTHKCIALLQEFHEKYSERAGMKREIIQQKLGLADKIFEKVTAYWGEMGNIVSKDGYFSLPAHEEKYNIWCEKLLAKSGQFLVDPGLTNIDSAMVGDCMNLPLQEQQVAFDFLVSKGILIQLDNLCIYAITMEYVIAVIHQYLQQNQRATVAQVRDILNTSRKITLVILEYLDMYKYTIRAGDERGVGPKMIEFSEK